LLATKAVRQKYQASSDLLQLLDKFRCMVNICVTIGIEQNISSLKTLASRAHPCLSRDILGYYRLGAIGAATGILRNYRKAKKKNPRTRLPYARKLMLNMWCGFKLQNYVLRLPVKPRKYVSVKLNGHTLQVLSGLNVRSVTITLDSLSISYSKETAEIVPEGIRCG